MGMLLALSRPLGDRQIHFRDFASPQKNYFQLASDVVAAQGVLHILHSRYGVLSYFGDDVSDGNSGSFGGRIGFHSEDD
jgi:hypothetical protein